jgi:ABC-type multidrug transport system ATPase subunit
MHPSHPADPGADQNPVSVLDLDRPAAGDDRWPDPPAPVLEEGRPDGTDAADQPDERADGGELGGLLVEGVGFALRSGRMLLREVDLRAERGTLTAVIGPSGAGKSTLSRVLTGLDRPSGGSVRFDEHDVHRSYDAVRSRIGLVPQDDVVHGQLRLRVALDYAARLRLPAGPDGALRRDRVDQVIERLGLEGNESTRIDTLSGGQRKRASVALELLTEPSLLVLDEPTSGLDPALDRQVMQTLRDLADGDRAVIVITHSVAFLDLCDQVLVLAPGGLPAYLGPTAGLQEHFGTSDWADIFHRVTTDPLDAHEDYRTASQPAPALALGGTVAADAPGGAGPEAAASGHPRDAGTEMPVDAVTPPADPDVRVARRRGPRWTDQFAALVGRQSRLVLADAGYLAFLAALPVVLGLLALVVPGDHGFTTPDAADTATSGEPTQLLALLSVGACFMGASVSVRDLIGERAIFLRERAVGLRVSAYLLSKIVVFGAISWASSAVLVGIVFLGKPVPESSAFLSDPRLELFLAVGLLASTSMIIGLFISASVRSGEQAMPILIVFVMSQLVLHGGLIPVTGRKVLDQLSWLMPARWGYAAEASGIDLNALVPALDVDVLWEPTTAAWSLAIGVLLAFSALFAGLSFVVLSRGPQHAR